ncbi:hypothetical protein [Tenacibaculum jejuense]|uniref:Transmembrane protein n=1 Tax=Tenacibaculum jejuense TaxID=584609 RepID=A0A238U5R8_9FLAO|nr:hypothetical protein [Tenacibaculum jejuense]SNR14346.1 conserved membrane protein of unknown function [Tenacibaculum jejuense]
MSWQKAISTILHPVVMPTIGILTYFIITPHHISVREQLYLFVTVFISTYIFPMFLLIFLKLIGKIKSFEVSTIKERKIPLFLMTCIFLFLGKFFRQYTIVNELSFLFYGTLLALIIVYFIFFLKIKTSLHLLSTGSALGFFVILQLIYNISLLPLLLIFTLLAGFLATARLDLKAHTPKEVYLGFLLGFSCQLIAYYTL